MIPLVKKTHTITKFRKLRDGIAEKENNMHENKNTNSLIDSIILSLTFSIGLNFNM